MSELLMECEEEELEPWQQKIKEVQVIDDDDDDDEPIFVREISSAKVTNTNNTAGAQKGTFTQVQNGTPNRGAAAAATSFQSPFNHYKSPTSNASAQPVPPMYQPATRPAASTAIGQSLPRPVCPPEPIKRPLPVQQSPRANPPMLQPACKPVTLVSSSQSACRNVTLSAMNQPTLRPAASITGQPVILNQGYSVNSPQNSSNNSPNVMYALRPSTPLTPYQGPQAVTATGNANPLVRPLQPSTQIHPVSTPPRASPAVTQRPLVTQNTLIPVQSPLSLNSQKPQKGIQGHGLSAGRSENASAEKRPSPIEIISISPKKPKLVENGPEIVSVSSLSSTPTIPVQIPPAIDKVSGKSGTTLQKNGAPFPRACPKCNIHFNLLEPLKRHMTYCCPDKMHNFLLGIAEAEVTSSQAPTEDSEKGKLIMLVSDFYYGQYPGNVLLMQQEQKTYTTFRCFSCQKLLKNNIRFMNHMKHHLELEKQSTESWENHTTCHHCYRQFPTPFQLQCHIECSHTLYETTTICKICELSYESEQVLLQHMKDNHKPGEMPYVCQVCNFRSSSFSDVDSHFRAVHENTKCLLCPFCLKVIKCGTPFMQHYVKHQNKGVYRCSKCRLQFLTCKEKMDHKTQHHKTFKKPKQLEGLPPGTKITIRASVGSLNSAPSTTSVCTSPPTTPIQASSKSKSTGTKVSQSLGSKSKPPPQKKPTATITTTTTTTTSTTKRIKMLNSALRNLGAVSGLHKCMECQQEVKDFENHFHTYVHCSKCKFSTSCSKAYMNHTMSFHGRNSHKRTQALKSQKNRRNITLVCLNCDFLADLSGIDDMAKHLGDYHSHSCQVVMEPVSIYSSTLEGVMSKSRFDPSAGLKQIYCKKESDTDVSGIKSNSTEEQCEQVEKQEETNTEESNEEIQQKAPLINRPMTPEDCDSGNTDNSIKNDAARKAEALSKAMNDCNAVEEQQSPIEEESRQTPGVSTFTDEGEKLKLDLKSSDETGDHTNFHYIGDDGVSFEQFLRRRDEPESVGSDISDQSSVHLEPLTPSEVLEHEATEILQKGTPQQKCSIDDQARDTADAEPAVSEDAPEEDDGGS